MGLKEKIEDQFEKAFKIFDMNKDCLTLYYIFQKWIIFENISKINIDDFLNKIIEIQNQQKRDIRKAINNNTNLESNSHIVMIKVKKSGFLISHASFNCLKLFEVNNEDDLIGKSINKFMPDEFAEKHDEILNKYLAKSTKSILEDNLFDIFLISNKLNLSEVLIARILDYSDLNYIYITGIIIEKRIRV